MMLWVLGFSMVDNSLPPLDGKIVLRWVFCCPTGYITLVGLLFFGFTCLLESLFHSHSGEWKREQFAHCPTVRGEPGCHGRCPPAISSGSLLAFARQRLSQPHP